MSDDTDEDRLLLGLAGWPHPEWRDGYFPDGLPEDWHFAYYANEAGCLLLPARDWQSLGVEEIAGWCDDVPDFFRFWLEWSSETDLDDRRLAAFGHHLGGVLSGPGEEQPAGLAVWRAVDAVSWRDPAGRYLVRWRIGDADLRSLRQRMQALPQATRALVVEDAMPERLGELRTLAELLGIA